MDDSSDSLRKKLEALESELRQSRDETAALHDVLDLMIERSHGPLEQGAFEEPARFLFNMCRKQIGARSGCVALYDGEGVQREVLLLDPSDAGCNPGDGSAMLFPGLRSRVFESRKPAFENAIEKSDWKASMPEGHVPIKNVLLVPLVHGGAAVGILGLADKASDFTQRDADIASIFGKLAAIELRDAARMKEVREAESALAHSDRKLRALFDTMNEGVCIHETVFDEARRPVDFRVLDVNSAYERITGIPKEKARGCMVSALYAAGNPPLMDAFIRAAGTGEPDAFEVFWPSMQKHFLVSAAISRKFLFITVFTDITELKEKEAQLRMFKSAIDKCVPGVALADADANLTYINEALVRMLGYEKEEELIGKPVATVWHRPEEMESRFPDMFKGSGAGIEARLKRKNGSALDAHIMGTVLMENGKPETVMSSIIDITERKQSELDRENLRAQLSNAVEMAHLGHWKYDFIRDVFSFNDHFYKIFRTTAEEVGGYSMTSAEYASRFVHPEDIPLVAREIQTALEADDPEFRRNLEHRMIYSDGTIGYISVRFFIVKDVRGRTIGSFGVNQDITERKKMEEELLRSRKLESVGLLAGGIAHDFNNILAAILGNIAMAKLEVQPGVDLFDLLVEAESASKKAQALTRQLLTFAKGGAPVRETASIDDIIRESSRFVLRGAKSRCEFAIARDLRAVEVDVGQISQVINNIVINANQAMPEGGVIRIFAENRVIDDESGLPVMPGRYIRISVRDQGVGIAEKHLSKVFDPYFTTKQQGSGLGLATAFSIVRKHDGHITAESNLGEGTTFHIYLPASDKVVPEKEEPRLIKGGGRVLVMDDEAPLRTMVGRMLQKLGYEGAFAKDGAEAVAKVEAATAAGTPYDAVILDLTVPGGMGGKETLQHILKIAPDTRAVVSSGYSEDPVMAEYRSYGFMARISKPFAFQVLSEVLHELLGKEE